MVAYVHRLHAYCVDLDVLILIVVDNGLVRETGNPLDTKDSQHFGQIAQEIIQLIKEDPEAAKNEDLQVYSGEVQDFLTFLRCFTLNTQI